MNNQPAKDLLMIAYAFPPINASGTNRPFYFAKHLGELGYNPVVLTRLGAGPYGWDEQPLAELTDRCEIVSVPPGDGDDWTSWVRRRLGWMDLPLAMVGLGRHAVSDAIAWRYIHLWRDLHDWVHWIWPATLAGLRQMRRRPIAAIWATAEPWSSLKAGYVLSRMTGKPLIVDIRDPWTYGPFWDQYGGRYGMWHRRWEDRILRHARRIVYTSPMTTEVMAGRCGKWTARRMVTITNGYSGDGVDPRRDVPADKCLFCHVGILSRLIRNPQVLLEGLKLACRDPQLACDVRLQFIGLMDGYEREVTRLGLDDQVVQTPRVSQKDSRRYMRGADVLVLLQTITGPGSDVIAGKAYEYLAAGRPILSVVSDEGGDAWLARTTRAGVITGVTDPQRVAEGIRHYWRCWKAGELAGADPSRLAQFSRRNLTGQLAKVLDDVVGAEAR